MDPATKSPEEWLQFIINERKTYNGPNKYKYWMRLYRKAADSIPANDVAHNNYSYAKIMVDFAKLQARTSEEDARTIFQAAWSNVKYFSLIYVAWAQFEILNNNPKKCKKLLEKGKQFCAKPGYLLDMALENFKSGNNQLIDEETEEYTFTELINASKTENYTDRLVETRRQSCNSSLEGNSFSPEEALTESSEKSDEVITRKTTKPSTSTDLSSIEELKAVLPEWSTEQHVSAGITTTSEGKTTDKPYETEENSSFLNDAVKEKHSSCNFSTDTRSMEVIEESTSGKNKPVFSDITSQLTNTQIDFKDNFKAPDVKRSFPKQVGNVGGAACRSDVLAGSENKMTESALPVFNRVGNKSHSSSGSESSEDIDTLSLKKSLLNAGRKTSLMDFATPQNKYSGQNGARKAGENTFESSLTKERKKTRRTKRQGFVGLPQRIPKLTDGTGVRQEDKKDTINANNEMIEQSVLKVKDDSIDGVFAFPQDGEVGSDHNLLVSKTGCVKENIDEPDSISKHKLTISPETVSTQPAALNYSSGFTVPPEIVNGNKFSSGTQSIPRLSRVDEGNEPACRGREESQIISGENSQPVHSTQRQSFSNNDSLSLHTNLTGLNKLCRADLAAEKENINMLVSDDGKLKSASLSGPNSSVLKKGRGDSHSKLDNAMPVFRRVLQDIDKNPKTVQNITVNGKAYSKLNLIGRGGSSEVYTVFDSEYSQYALKYVNINGADATVIKSYVNEITLLKRLQGHESIIKLYDWEMDEQNKVIKILLERGSTDLAGYLKKNPDKITVDFIKMCWKKMLDAVDVVHKAGIIHTDLKPANFLLVEWNLKLIDFGIANAIQSDVTSFYRDSTIGTLSYMSPEALKDVSCDQRDQDEQRRPIMKIGRPSDVWSLGCILYVMVYGKTPFQHIRNNFQKWSCIIDPACEIKFPPIENQDLLDSMKGCLRRDPSKRYTIAQLKNHPFLTGRTSANDVDNVLNCLMQMQDIKSPGTLRTFAQNLIGHLSSGSSLNMASVQSSQTSREGRN